MSLQFSDHYSGLRIIDLANLTLIIRETSEIQDQLILSFTIPSYRYKTFSSKSSTEIVLRMHIVLTETFQFLIVQYL